MQHKYNGPTVLPTREIIHSCVCGKRGSEDEIVDHLKDMIEMELMFDRMNKREPGAGWLKRVDFF